MRVASYGPLFAHVDAWQWTPDLIWVNNLAVLPTANYYVQQLFSRNRSDKVLPTALKDEASQSAGTLSPRQRCLPRRRVKMPLARLSLK
jgi:hypothetical protein